ncbi:DUF3426 domain-containing protein [Psychrobacter aestuarii]|uniref:DUF3426 domain-containing protein n=1 Tax=Psychrobacter aestuarii TaxID=556327 RepID=A0ABP3FLH3_9GAMM|nr:DUF3426 domain-containing protein [Psychrobacter aestuarii]
MVTLVTTQCPHCQTTFDIPSTQFEDKTAKGRCSHCHNTFLINEHIVGATSNDSAPTSVSKAKAETPKPVPNKPMPAASDNDEEILDDGLIHDDMDIDDDDADALAQMMDLDSLLDEDFDTTIAKPAISTHKPTAESTKPSPALSSSAANDIHANAAASGRPAVDENAWLEGLLKEKDQEDTHHNNNENSDNQTDLTALLTQMGMQADNSPPSIRPQSPRAQVPTSPALPIASMLWGAGCVVLALLLLAQYMIFNVDSIIKNPNHANRLQSICAIAACSLPSADLNALTMNQIFYRPSTVKDDDYFSDIGADIVNQSDNAQLLPTLKVNLYGERDTLLGDFVAQPEDYVLSPHSQMGANSTLPVLFTVPIANQHIQKISIQPLY